MVYLFISIIILIVGFYFSSNDDSETVESFLGGRKRGWFVTGLSSSVNAIIPLSILFFLSEGRVSVFYLFLGGSSAVILMVSHPRLQSMLMEISSAWLDRKWSGIAGTVLLFVLALVQISFLMFLSTVIFKHTLQIDAFPLLVVLLIFVGVYTIAGGRMAVVTTQVVQGLFLVMILLLLPFSFFVDTRVSFFSQIIQMVGIQQYAREPGVSAFFGAIGAPLLVSGIWLKEFGWMKKTDTVIPLNITFKGIRFGVILSGVMGLMIMSVTVLQNVNPAVAPGTSVTGSLSEFYALMIGIGMAVVLMGTISGTLMNLTTVLMLDIFRRFLPSRHQRLEILVGRMGLIAGSLFVFAMILAQSYINSSIIPLYLIVLSSTVSPLLGVAAARMTGLVQDAERISKLLIFSEVTALFMMIAFLWKAYTVNQDGEFIFDLIYNPVSVITVNMIITLFSASLWSLYFWIAGKLHLPGGIVSTTEHE